MYVRGSILTEMLTSYKQTANVKDVSLEINLQKEKRQFVRINAPPS